MVPAWGATHPPGLCPLKQQSVKQGGEGFGSTQGPWVQVTKYTSSPAYHLQQVTVIYCSQVIFIICLSLYLENKLDLLQQTRGIQRFPNSCEKKTLSLIKKIGLLLFQCSLQRKLPHWTHLAWASGRLKAGYHSPLFWLVESNNRLKHHLPSCWSICLVVPTEMGRHNEFKKQGWRSANQGKDTISEFGEVLWKEGRAGRGAHTLGL